MALLPAAAADGDTADIDLGGHVKLRLIYLGYPADSAIGEILGNDAIDNGLETRLNFSAARSAWDFRASYQLIALRADTLKLAEALPALPPRLGGVIDDGRRWWNLTRVSQEGGGSALINRLDRLSISYTSGHTVLRFGRQAISWGNGLVFTPMDVFNPFDPSAVDKEYKTGDDMLYGQYLFDSGADLQGVAVVRRDPRSGDVKRDQSSLAFKYHGFLGDDEWDLLAAEHYDELLLGLGGVFSLGGGILRGDLTWTNTDRQDVFSAVASLSSSWTWAGRNVTGALEYYHNGFGQPGGAYSPAELQDNPDLLARVERGELFTLGRDYLAASLTVEMTPLFHLIPNLYANLRDPSALAQLVAQYDWQQDLTLLAALNVPLGHNGSEYGGIEAPVAGKYFSTTAGLFVQMAVYF